MTKKDTATTPKRIIKPQALKPGARVGIACPASRPYSCDAVPAALALVEELGLVPVMGKHVLSIDGCFAGKDHERLEDFHGFLADRSIAAIFCLSGGYGAVRLLDRLDYSLIEKHPKLIVGPEDVSGMLLGIFQKTGLVSFFGPSLDRITSKEAFEDFAASLWLRTVGNTSEAGKAASGTKSIAKASATAGSSSKTHASTKFAETTSSASPSKEKESKETRETAKSASAQPIQTDQTASAKWATLTAEAPDWVAARHRHLKVGAGRHSGIVLGTNLNALISLLGTEYLPDFHDSILCLDDLEERNDSLERWMTQLYISGILTSATACAFGRFEGCGPRGTANVRSWHDSFFERLQEVKKPASFGFNFGDALNSRCIPIGIRGTLDIDRSLLEFDESPFG
jgi:muramoyltetrapeptide carboxypeptidase LdcA involved in peptidoglycan recycling